MLPLKVRSHSFRLVRAGVLTAALAIAGLDVAAPAAWAQGPPADLPGRGPIVLEGELDVLYEDGVDTARLVHFLRANNRRFRLRFADGNAPDLPTGSQVRVSGDHADGTITTTTTDVSVLAVSASQTLGNQDVLVILFNFSNNTSQPFSATTVANVNAQVKSYYLENTYGKTTLSFAVTGWYTIAATDATCDYSGWASQAEAKAANAGVNLAAYDRFVFAFPKAAACSWSGVGNVSGPRSWSNGGYSLRTIAHEQGHNFGDHHSKATTCDVATCATVEYGDDRDVMGKPGVTGHMNAFQKERLGWLNYGDAPRVESVSASGDYWIDNYENLAGYIKALKIYNSKTGGYYYIESRAKVGLDANVAAGVTLHSALSGISYQLDLDTTTTAYDSTLDVGQVFNDAAMGLSVEVLSSGLGGALVHIEMAAAPCTRRPPTVSVTAGGSMKFSVSVRNNNDSNCAAASFSLSTSLPVGWSSSFSPASVSLASGASSTSTLTLVAPTGTTGSFSFVARATDAGSQLSGSVTGTIVLASSLNVTVSTSISGGGGQRSVSIKVGVRAGTAPAAGAAVSAAVTNPKGSITTLSGTTGGDGYVTLKLALKPKDPSGTYQVRVTATAFGVNGQAVTTFVTPTF